MKFERIRYPDGQVSAKLVEGGGVDSCYIAERINSYEDLMYIRAIGDILDKQLIFKTLFIPCLFGQRSDRRFATNQSFDLKLIAEIINACNFNIVKILDPHSDVALALINNSQKLEPYNFVRDAVYDIRQKMCNEGLSPTREDILLVSPDAGAYKKVFGYGESLKIPVMGAMKHRDADGTIAISFSHDVEDKHCLIVDDLCDGGATFTSLATLLKLHKAAKVYLYVSHGLFSKGFLALTKDISHIYCTNSTSDLDMSNRGTLGGMELRDFVTQYKVI